MTYLLRYFPHLLLSVYVIQFVVLAIDPYSRAVWYAENIPIVATVLFIVVLYIRDIRFSNIAYLCMAILPYMHTVGGHYTFERVPFDWFNDFFSFERNMYDRVAHFTVGLYAYPLFEYVLKTKKVSSRVMAFLFSIFAIATVAMVYELIEWGYAVKAGGEEGIAFLGSQGDVWDAQKDMLMDTLGGIFAAGLAWVTLRVVDKK